MLILYREARRNQSKIKKVKIGQMQEQEDYLNNQRSDRELEDFLRNKYRFSRPSVGRRNNLLLFHPTDTRNLKQIIYLI